MNDYGFVYIWYDRKHNRYYVGCHWGHEGDGYICSSSWMKRAYKIRPVDFKRRIIARVYTSRSDLLIEENKWLSMIDQHELGTKYYNVTNHLNGHWSSNETCDRVKATLKSLHWSTDATERAEVAAKISAANTGKKRRKFSVETRSRMSLAAKSRSAETRKKISENSKRLHREGTISRTGKYHTDETKAKMSMNNAMQRQDMKALLSSLKTGEKTLILDGIRRRAIPGSDKWNMLLDSGYIPLEQSR